MLGKIFSGGAADLVKGVGGVIDNLHTSGEEKLEAERKIKEIIANYEVEMEKNITSRWEADLKSDSCSAHSQTAANTITPPTGQVIVAIQFLDDLSLDVLTPEQIYGVDAFIGIDAALSKTDGGSEVIDSNVSFPAGITIVGRWTHVSLASDNASGIICYFGQ